MMDGVKPELPHMLGITPLGKVHDPDNERMTLLDSGHPFWKEYEESVRTRNRVTEKVETAIRSLKEDGSFRLTYPYGEEADIIYVEVDKLTPQTRNMKTTCKECGEPITAQPDLQHVHPSQYCLAISLDCEACDFDAVYEQTLDPR